jgi:excinuclease ABC subunit C
MHTDISSIPSNPGIYIFKNAKEKFLYVGKAKNLKNRIRSYFQKSSGLDARKSALVKEIKNVTFIVTGNELEAFVLEANLIKQHKPKFNVILRDDKSYPYLKLTVNEEWPKIEVVRRIHKDGALYFGPYVPSGPMWGTLAFIRRYFRIRDCKHALDRPIRPCIQYQMGRCLAPCAGYISREEYMKLIEEIRLFLSGENKDLIAVLEKKMMKLSNDMEYEEAAKIRDRIKAIEKVRESQKIISPEIGDIDVIGFYRQDDVLASKVFFIRKGVMIGSKDYSLRNTAGIPDKALTATFLVQLYSKEIIPPPEIIISQMPEEAKSLKTWLSQRGGRKTKITIPRSGKKRELVDMASENARFLYRSVKETSTEEILDELKDKLHLKKRPERIGAFDVSNISGSEAVGSFVFWSDGEFRKDGYRRLRIKTVEGIDDYAMMAETVRRTIKNLKGDLPDLVIIDGGKGHLETAQKVFGESQAVVKIQPELIGLAKDPDRAYLTAYDIPADIEDKRPSSLLLKSIRDEAHRFAVGYHRKLRDKRMLRSPLEEIHGVGKKRRLELLRVFGSIKGIKKAGVEDIAKLRGFNKTIAEHLHNELRRSE